MTFGTKKAIFVPRRISHPHDKAVVYDLTTAFANFSSGHLVTSNAKYHLRRPRRSFYVRTETEKRFTAIRARGLSLCGSSHLRTLPLKKKKVPYVRSRIKRSTQRQQGGVSTFLAPIPTRLKEENFHFKERGRLLQLIRILMPLFTCMLHSFNYSSLGDRKTFFYGKMSYFTLYECLR